MATLLVGDLVATWLSRTYEDVKPWLGVAVAIAFLGYVAVVIAFLGYLWMTRGIQPSVCSLVTVGGAAFFIGWVYFHFSLHAHWYLTMALLAVAAIPMSVANAAVRRDARREQHRRDVFASAILADVRASVAHVRPFALYLRPFASTERLPAQPIGSLADMGAPFAHLDVEALLTRALRKDCPLIALGLAGAVKEGAGRATVAEGEWRDDVLRLEKRAVFDLIVPSAHLGTLWELDLLVREGQLNRTLFVMPEQPREITPGAWVSTEDDRFFDAGVRRHNPEQHVYDIACDWAAVAAQMQSRGVTLPPYAPAGALFVLDPCSGSLARSAPLALSSLTRRAWYLRTAVRYLGLIPDPTRGAVDVLDAFAKAVSHRGHTLEHALILAVDLYLTWSDTDTATNLMRRAVIAGGRRPRFSHSYCDAVESKAAEMARNGEEAAAHALRIWLQRGFN
jgi:hypothetical protein